MVRTIGLVAVLWLSSATQVAAQQRDTTVFRVGEIVVQAARPVTTTGGSSAIEVRLDSMALPPAPTLEQVLRELPMVHVRTNSRGEAEIAVRGSESRQVAVLMDGVPLTLGWDSRTDASIIPATAARQISLVRGLSTLLYGPNVLGGVIELGIGHGSSIAQRHGELSAGVDETGGYAMAGSATIPVQLESGSLLLRAGGGFRDVPGQPLADGIAEPITKDEDLRLNTDARQVDGFVSARRDFGRGGWLSFASSGYRGRRGIAAELGVDEPRLWRYPTVSRLVAVASAGSPEGRSPLGGVGDVEASVGIDMGRTEIDEYATRAYDEIVGGENGDDRTMTVRLRADNTIGRASALHLAGTFADITHDEQLDDDAAATYQQRLWSVASEFSWRLRNVRATAGAALDGASTPQTGGKPALGALRDWGARLGVTAVLSDGDVLAHAGASRRVRFPALRELYSGALNRFEPNPGLRPEQLLAGEAGITTRIRNGELQVVGFYHQLSDAVVRVRTPAGLFRRVNQHAIDSYGVELLGGTRLGRVSVQADLTVQQVTLDDPSAPDALPESQPEVFGNVQAHALLPLELEAGVAARHTGSQYCIDPQSGDYRTLDSHTRLDADVARTWQIGGSWFSRVEARVAVDNLADSAGYDLCALPQPGRLARFQVRLF